MQAENSFRKIYLIVHHTHCHLYILNIEIHRPTSSHSHSHYTPPLFKPFWFGFLIGKHPFNNYQCRYYAFLKYAKHRHCPLINPISPYQQLQVVRTLSLSLPRSYAPSKTYKLSSLSLVKSFTLYITHSSRTESCAVPQPDAPYAAAAPAHTQE